MNDFEIFGPVPSRRLGRSVGINHIPYKKCTYSCVYCQLGKTARVSMQLQSFFDPQIILKTLEKKLQDLGERNQQVDYLTLVPDGEPSLDISLKELLIGLKQFHIPLAVISNASLLWLKQVQDALCHADVVSLKVDAVEEQIWQAINHPHKALHFAQVLQGMLDFAHLFQGIMITETMLVRAINDSPQHLVDLVSFLQELDPAVAYIAVPTRPAAEANVMPAEPEVVMHAYQLFSSTLKQVELLVEPEGDDFAVTGDIQQDILSIASVHPLSTQKLDTMLHKTNSDWSVIDELLNKKLIRHVRYQDQDFYIRNFTTEKSSRMLYRR